MTRRLRSTSALQALALLILLLALGSLAALIADVWADGASRLSWSFLTGFPSRRAADAGIYHALSGSVFVILVTGALAVPIGVASAIYLEEYGRRNFLARIIEINITNLAAVPSIIYGLLGLGLFVRAMGMGRSVWRALRRSPCSSCRSSSWPHGKRSGPFPRPFAKGRMRWAPPSGRRSGPRCCPSRFRVS